MENGKNRFWKGVLVGALVMAFTGLIIVGFSAGIFLIGKTVIENQAQRVEGNPLDPKNQSDRLDMAKVNKKLGLLQQIVDELYLFDEKKEDLEDGIYTGYMFGLRDPYSTYYNEKNYASLQEDTEGVYCGIGAMVTQNRDTNIMTITKVFKGAPSFEAGMLPGDIIYKVDGENVAGTALEVVISELIRGKKDTYVTVTVLRGEDNEEVELKIQRREVEVPTVEYQMLEDQIGYVNIIQFDDVTGPQFKQAVENLETQGMERMLLDLRGNPGGTLDSVVEILAYMLPEDKQEGMLLYTSDKDEKGDRYFSKNGKLQFESDYGVGNSSYPKEDVHELNIPIAVLVNGNSASAAEVLTGAIMDYDWGTVVGTKTFGKGIVQNVIPLGDGTAIKLTTSHYYTPSGFDLHQVGLTPDVEVELDEELKKQAIVKLEEDNQVEKALEVLKRLSPP